MNPKKDPAREGRLARALKANLKRRKAQAKAKAGVMVSDPGLVPGEPRTMEGEADKGPNAAPKKR